MIINIIPLDNPEDIKKTAKMAARVFPYIALHVRLTFLLYRSNKSIVKHMLRLVGVREQIKYWVAVNEHGKIVGTIGLYSNYSDSNNAVWMAYFCVDQNSRRQGIGRKLVVHAIEQARAIGVPYFRLYTSTLRNESNSHSLYYEYGFRVVKVKSRLFYKLLYMQMDL